MMHDHYGLNVSTSDINARNDYAEGCDLLARGYPGSVEAFDRAVAADPGFALAHAARARSLQLSGNAASARDAMEAAKALTAGVTEREASHVAALGLIIAGRPQEALDAVLAHLRSWPRDAMILTTCATQAGLIGISGRDGREQALSDLLDVLAPHYGDDPWFVAHHAMALNEVGQKEAARRKAAWSMGENPSNCWAAHAWAHVCYEAGEAPEAIDFLHGWLPSYPSQGFLHCHLSWHLALFELADGNAEEALRLYGEAIAPPDFQGPSFLKVVDGASLLWRAELAGLPRDPVRWRLLKEFAHAMFPRPGNPFVDWHVALADAAAGDETALEARVQEMEQMAREGRYPAAPVLPAFARGFEAFARRDFERAIALIRPLLGRRECIPGSRAQTDLVEFTLMRAYLEAGRIEEARALLRARRSGPLEGPVAGLDTLQ